MTQDTPDIPEPAKTENKAKALAGAAMKTSDNIGKVAEGAGNAFSAIKWVAIAATFGSIAFIGYFAYKLVVVPAKAVGNAAESMTESVKSGASSVKAGTSEMLNRLDIPASAPDALNTLSETAFKAVSEMTETPPEGVKQRLHWRTNFSGHQNRVCELSMTFGAQEVPVLISADNKAYAAAKALGSKNDRELRIVLRAPGDDVPLNVVWDNEQMSWAMKWKGTTVSKPLSDVDAQTRILDVLKTAAAKC